MKSFEMARFQFLQSLISHQYSLVLVAACQYYLLKMQREPGIAKGQMNNYTEKGGIWMQERYWLGHWTASHIVSNRHLESSRWLQPGNITAPTRSSPLVNIVSDHLDPISKGYLSQGTNFPSQPMGPATEIVSTRFVLITRYFWRTPIFVIKSNIGSPGAPIRLHALESKRSHYHWSPIAWINWGLLIILIHTCGFRPCFAPSSLLPASSPWLH